MSVLAPPALGVLAGEVTIFHNLSFKHDARGRARPPSPQSAYDAELERTRSELRSAAEERENLVQAYEEYIEKLQRENRQLVKSGASERSEIGLSRKLVDIETQNERIMENLRSTTATLSENEKSYIGKINLLFAEKQALEQQVAQLQQKMGESVVQNSRYDKVKQQLREANLELENERERGMQLSQSEKKLQRRVDSVEAHTRERARTIASLEAELELQRQQNAQLRAELADSKQLKDGELRALNDRLEQLIALTSSKDSEIGRLRKELTRSGGARARRPEEAELARRKNAQLNQKLDDLTHKYDDMMELLGRGSGAKPRREASNPFVASEVDAGRTREPLDPRGTPAKHCDEASTTSGGSAPNSAVGVRRPQHCPEVRPFTLPTEQAFSPAPRQPGPPPGFDATRDQVSRVLVNGKVVYAADATDAALKDPAALQRYVTALTGQELKKIRGSLRANEVVTARPRNASNPTRLEAVERLPQHRQVYGETYPPPQPYEQLQRTVVGRPASGQPYPDYFTR